MSASATCKITGESGVTGILRLAQSAASAPTTIQGEIRGLTPGKHGITVNVSGDLTEGAASTGDIFNPFGAFAFFVFYVSAFIATGFALSPVLTFVARRAFMHVRATCQASSFAWSCKFFCVNQILDLPVLIHSTRLESNDERNGAFIAILGWCWNELLALM